MKEACRTEFNLWTSMLLLEVYLSKKAQLRLSMLNVLILELLNKFKLLLYSL
jgi:hypothetical protein